MARGKYKTRAANARAEQSQAEQLDAYQHAIRRLTGERDQLRQQLAALTSSHAAEAKALRQQLAAGTSLEVVALERENQRLREERDAAVARRREVQEKWDRAFGRLLAWFEAEEGLTRIEALERAGEVTGAVPAGFTISHGVGGGTAVGAGTARRIQAARGIRRGSGVR